ncbi:glycosyltransferase family protein [Aliarcobacter vitoriensis]|uniref:Uncharacterized protein n=1 Tax=Aliarcobacter vitoriensis TaxID=2011099 RepID=A0A366MSH4_9BACT|nr:glycosyltransferase family 4 protein [Aliarcobacter vitoriensis]RBQ29238.1 hypothetical protein CRU91_05255 [Aliarcobacter vitoriensis]
MKIAYVLIHDIKTNDGITKKILGQKTEWENSGHKVELYTTMIEKGDSILPSKQYISKSPFKLRFQVQNDMLQDIDNFNPDLVYFRYNTWSRTWSLLTTKYKSVVELNTYDLGEYLLFLKKEKTLKAFLRYIGYKFMRGLFLGKVNGIIGVTKEIAEHKDYTKYNKPATYIPNAIDLKIFSTFKSIKTNLQDRRVGLFFIGSPGFECHGVRHIINLAKNLPEYDFHIVGIDGNNSSNLYWHGYMNMEQYMEVLKSCDICISSLATYEKNITEACPLKAREYLAYGYPMILGYDDTAFIDKSLPNWILKIDTQKPLDFDSIRKFIEKNKNVIISHDEIRFIDTAILEKKRLEFFKIVCNL